MARPPRHNADYYTHDADLRNDRRVKAIRTKFGAAGYGLLHMILETLTDADHTQLDTEPLEVELLAGDFGVSATEIHELLQFGESIGYFHRNEASLLICPELNKWLEPVFEKRNRTRNAAPAALLSQAESEMGVSVTVNPQSKVKKSKVKDDVEAGKDEVVKIPPNPARDAAIATTDPADEQLWNISPLTKPKAFQIICERLGYHGLAFEKYRKRALVAAEDGNISRTVKQWTSWIGKYIENQGQLIMQSVDMPTTPTPRNEWPEPGQETAGQIIAIEGVPNDANLNRIKIATYQKNWPTAHIHAIL